MRGGAPSSRPVAGYRRSRSGFTCAVRGRGTAAGSANSDALPGEVAELAELAAHDLEHRGLLGLVHVEPPSAGLRKSHRLPGPTLLAGRPDEGMALRDLAQPSGVGGDRDSRADPLEHAGGVPPQPLA